MSMQTAFILHTRPYRNTSMLIDVFTREYGCVGAISRGVRRPKSPIKSLLQPFYPLWVKLAGRGELLYLNQTEARGMPFHLTGTHSFCGMYMNELLSRLTIKNDPHPEIFDCYAKCLGRLAESDPNDSKNQQRVLRTFEKRVLSELGYAIQCNKIADNNEPIQENDYYHYQPHIGFIAAKKNMAKHAMVFSGHSLLAIEQEHFEETHVLHDAKRLLRTTIQHLLGNKTLKSRDLFK